MTGNQATVVVAMSGGVDSSVAAALLVEQGYNVIGMMMRLWSEETAPGLTGHNRCCTPEQMNDARRVADMLDIPFYVLDTRDVFRNKIVQFFIDQHADGLTPNPCLACNMHIRFDWLLNNALALGADYLATGHYARITQSAEGLFELRKGRSLEKDQSYVLSVMTQEQLRYTLFPVGEYIKPQVRELAANFGLPVASKHDSQDLCFLGDGDYRRFLREHGPVDLFISGPILNRRGEQVGTHDGLPNYTIGQRKGLGISGSGDPLYVLDLDRQRNAVIVGTRDELGRDRLIAGRVNWIAGAPPAEVIRAEVKIRYKAKPAPATLEALPDGRVNVIFDDPLRDITPGQGAVFYDGDRCLGGGLIHRVEHLESAIISS
ncbi:MAG: tRNA 2-thiouridine(34) synthase MnmA [Anaerolineae bacterium]|nr:MAG: tRNA 2-thiouridine(34) synthase MnmA [Anaerolineae bacterium]